LFFVSPRASERRNFVLMPKAPTTPGTLYLVGTPIGNLEDLTLRAVRVLGEVDLVAAEDTRTARKLLAHLDLRKPTVSLNKDNEARRAEQVLEALSRQEAVALISEAGMPGISDPGERLVRRCLEREIPVDVIPGPSAVLAALCLSGLPALPFTFFGFLPRKGRRRKEQLARLVQDPATAVIFESPRRTAATLADLADALGERQAALARELTKVHQQVVRGSLAELAERARQEPPRGEVTLVVAGAPPPEAPDDEALSVMVRQRLEQGESPRQIADALGELGRRRVYQLALALGGGS